MKILHITYGFNGGGVGFVIANYCANQPMEGICFDIVGEDIGMDHLLHKRFEKAGFHIYYVTPKKRACGRIFGRCFTLSKMGIMMLSMFILRSGHFSIYLLPSYVVLR